MKHVWQRAASGVMVVAALAMPQMALANHRDVDDVSRTIRIQDSDRFFDSRVSSFTDRDILNDGRFRSLRDLRDRLGLRDGFLLWCRRLSTSGTQLFICQRL